MKAVTTYTLSKKDIIKALKVLGLRDCGLDSAKQLSKLTSKNLLKILRKAAIDVRGYESLEEYFELWGDRPKIAIKLTANK